MQPAPYGQYPPHQYPPPQQYPPPPGIGLPRPTAVAPVPGTHYALALVEVTSTVSGPAVASLSAGIGSTVASLVVAFFAAIGARPGWGPAVAGAFAILAALAGAAAIGLYRVAGRRIRTTAAWGPSRGRGLAVAGLVCGLVGLGITALAMLASLATSE